MILRLRNICKAFDEKIAVNNLSLEVPKGVIYGIIGPNGAGKTTSIRMIMNITMPDSGEVLYNGLPIDDSFKDHVGYLPEERGLYKKMTLSEILTYMAQLKGLPVSEITPRIDPWLERVGLLDRKENKVEELSKGMQQKLQFVSTILHDPEIIILDEIFSGLDPLNMELIKEILLDLKRKGRTILFSTHVMEQAEKLCDYICMISRGRKVLDGRLSEVKAQFGKNSVQVEIEGDGQFMSGLDGVVGLTKSNNYCELKLAPNADTNRLLVAIAERVKVRRFEMVVPSLYDIFIQQAKADPDQLSEREAKFGV